MIKHIDPYHHYYYDIMMDSENSSMCVPTPYWCTIIEKGTGCVFCDPLLLPPGPNLCSSLTYTSLPQIYGQLRGRVGFYVRVTPHHVSPYMDTVDIVEEILCNNACIAVVELQNVGCQTEAELLAFRAVNELGVELFITKRASRSEYAFV